MMIPSNRVDDGQGSIWLNDVDCSGTETKLLNCSHSIETSQCHHYEDVGLHCFLSCPAEENEGMNSYELNVQNNPIKYIYSVF